MGFENSAGLDVSNHYGPRDTGGNEGITKTEGSVNEWSYDKSQLGLQFGFPSPGTGDATVYVTDVSAAIPSQTVTSLDIGGVAVEAATKAVPIAIPAGNTGVISGFAGTAAGRIFVTYEKAPI
jgi:hypothetical protein